MASLISAFDAILSDLDGVVYAGPDAIDGAVDSLNQAQAQGVQVAYVTNNASRSVQTVAEHLNRLGLHTDAEHVVSSAQAAARLAREHLPAGARVQVCGAQALRDCAREAGFEVVGPGEDAVALLQGFNPELGWQDLAEAAYLLADPDVLWIASNTDLTIPKERGIAPGNGTLVGAVATATRRTPLVAGKPEAPIFRTITERLGVSAPVVVGDRLDTDLLGANTAGLPGIMVMTGVQTLADMLNAVTAERPQYVVANLRELFQDYEQPTVEQDGDRVTARIGQDVEAVATAEGVTVTGPDGTPAPETGARDLRGWRAAAAAWWARHPEVAEPTDATVRWTA